MSFTDSVSEKINMMTSNKYIKIAIIAILVIYGGLVASQLPKTPAKFLSHPIIILASLVAIAYAATKDMQIALIASIVLLITIISGERYKSRKQIERMQTTINDNILSEAFNNLQTAQIFPIKKSDTPDKIEVKDNRKFVDEKFEQVAVNPAVKAISKDTSDSRKGNMFSVCNSNSCLGGYDGDIYSVPL